jgi:hypothetical protein
MAVQELLKAGRFRRAVNPSIQPFYITSGASGAFPPTGIL